MKSKSSSPPICRVCGDIARGVNFSAVTCMPCKMFFRRHAQSELFKQKCHFNGQCEINRRTRKFCLPCRLQQCFKVGMDSQLIRFCSQQKKTISVSKPTTLSLLNNDRSKLTIDEWNLLTNIINTYDEQNLFLRTTDFLKNQLSLPPKIRSKDSHTLNHIESLFSTMHTFIDRCPLFYSLPVDIRKHLIKHNLSVVGGFNGFFMAKEMNIFNNEIYSKYIDNIYGNDYSNSIIQAGQRLQQNGTLIKILLMILIFSNNYTIVTKDQYDNIQMAFGTNIINRIQNIFITLLWKYLDYQYGFHEAILILLSLVKSILDFMQRMDEGSKIQKHWTMVENVIEQTTHSLKIEDSPMKE